MQFRWLTRKRLIRALKRLPELRKIRNFRVASMKQLLDKIRPTNSTVKREKERQEKIKRVRFF